MAAGVLDSEVRSEAATPPREQPRWRRWLRLTALMTIIAAVVSSPWWGPLALARLDYFHVRRVEFEGVRYTRTAELLSRLRLDTLQSVWQPLPPLAERIEGHPLVQRVLVERRLPGTLVVRIVEREPVALVPGKGQLQPADRTGQRLPIDPLKVPLDLPIAGSADSALMATLDALRKGAPGLYARIVQAQRVGAEEMRFQLDTLVVRTGPDVTVARFKDILPVEADLARNAMRVVELDLRFRNQVIARQP